MYACVFTYGCFDLTMCYNRDFGKWEKHTTGFGSRMLAKVCMYVHLSKL